MPAAAGGDHLGSCVAVQRGSAPAARSAFRPQTQGGTQLLDIVLRRKDPGSCRTNFGINHLCRPAAGGPAARILHPHPDEGLRRAQPTRAEPKRKEKRNSTGRSKTSASASLTRGACVIAKPTRRRARRARAACGGGKLRIGQKTPALSARRKARRDGRAIGASAVRRS